MAAPDYFLVVPVREAENPGKVKKQWWILGFVLLALIAAVIVAINLSPKEPVFEGKPESFWVDQLPASLVSSTWTGGRTRLKHYRSSSEAERKARGVLERAGTNALPYLAEGLSSRDSLVERLAVKLSYRHPYRLALVQRIWKPPFPWLTSADVRRGQALTAILDCHFDKNEVVPALRRILKGDNAQAVECAKWALREIDPEAAAKAGVK